MTTTSGEKHLFIYWLWLSSPIQPALPRDALRRYIWDFGVPKLWTTLVSPVPVDHARDGRCTHCQGRFVVYILSGSRMTEEG
ncbi:hypothetical protein H6F61_21975 [Cyanobacteria bacterium FACHB-472]|nr:hypothetical protein [Cyanobacteria bacterium FACHB-472]